jgi:hypothetical protein
MTAGSTAFPSDRLDRGQERLSRLADAAGALRSRRGPGGPSDRWLLIAGGILMPLGVVLILLGWYGAAQTALPFEQTPYVLSGGVLGLALVVGGGFLYFAYWLTLFVRESRSERESTLEHQARLERLLVELAGRVGQASSTPARERVVTTPSGTLLHRPECVATMGLDVVEVPFLQPGFSLCGLCQPVAPPPEPVTPEPVTPEPVTPEQAQPRRVRAPRAAR